MEEALAVWEVSKVLEISFKGGKKTVLKKVCEIEEDASRAGGLLCLWDGDWFLAEVQIIKDRFIATIGKLKSSGWQCGFLNVYGPLMDSEKRYFFGDLLTVLSMFNVSWFIGGDFNSILNVEEKSGNLVNGSVMDIFRQFVQEAELVDLPLQGGSFTWSSNRKPPTLVRLDRFLLSHQILSAFPGFLQQLLDSSISDHHAIFLSSGGYNWGPRPFKFFSYMLEEEGFVDKVVSNL
ncbi:hypothetical protein V6N11_031289 [Hibiscus sabdariffa]|uniref:Endonuclease/exonuclease/phosphatase domain-containing protein n=1 Tax=Hibiscus sabdariffa TaxID=183260 RepID=A0ABR2SY07_9ROSI